MKNFFTLLLLLCLSFVPAHAQWGAFTKGLRKQARTAQRFIVKPVGVTQRQLDKAVWRAGKKTPPGPIVAKAARSLIPLRERGRIERLFGVDGTSFAITYQGKTYGVAASHYHYKVPAIKTSRFSHEKITFEVQGHPSANDVSIFHIPESLADKFEPLPLAEKSPEVGDILFSVSFFDGKLQYTPGRKVLETAPMRFITSVKADVEINHEGECGSPLVKNGEVVGMVVGLSYNQQIGFAVPVEQIRQALQEYHQRESAAQPIVINGKELFKLDITEAITHVSVNYRDGTFARRTTYHREKLLDYAHLETFMDLTDATQITLTIERKPFSSDQPRETHVREVTYDLQTQQSSVNIVR